MGTPTPVPSRAVAGPARVLRGAAGALAMTLLAALFHSAAASTPLPAPVLLLFSAVLAAPVCTLLAGRALSLWRTAAAVAVAQGLFHALYSVAAGGRSVATAAGVAPAHLAHSHVGAARPLLTVDAASETSAHAAHAGTPGMLLAHLAAAALTVAVLRHGERMLVAAAERVLQAAPVWRLLVALAAGLLPTPRPVRVPAWRAPSAPAAVVVLASPGRRGPPAFALAA